MVRGHKGFERVVWAFKNVLNHSITWLCCDLDIRTDATGPIAAHQPILREMEPEDSQVDNAIVPHFQDTVDSEDHIHTIELLEWLSLVTNLSPRVRSDDAIDKYLSRYNVPDLSDSPAHASETPSTATLALFRWRGFIPAMFISKILLAALKASAGDWLAISATSFSGGAYTILKTDDRTLIWEYMD